MAIHRPRLSRGSPSNTVGLPSGSVVVLTSPSGLLYISTRGLSSVTIFMGRPSTRIRSSVSARSPSLAVDPLTETRPAEIHFSNSRREPRPTVASNFCNFSLICSRTILMVIHICFKIFFYHRRIIRIHAIFLLTKLK